MVQTGKSAAKISSQIRERHHILERTPMHSPPFASAKQNRRRGGYTLLEVMLVVMIISMSGIFVMGIQRNSMKDARLREASRLVQVLNQHARNTAILKQMHVQVRYDNKQGFIEVVTLNRSPGAESQQIALGIEVSGVDNLKYDENESAGEREERLSSTGSSTVTKRNLPLGVRITEFESATDLFEQMEEVFRVDYWPTGYAQGHRVVLEDPQRTEAGVTKKVEITIENITGDVKVERINE